MKVLVCGAGLTGLALANRISALGGEAVVLERAPGPRAQGYMIDFFGPGYDAVAAMGLLPRVERLAYPVAEAVFVDERGRRRAAVEPAQFAAGPLLNLMRPDLERVLREALPPDVELRFGTGPAAVDARDDGVRVTLEDGTALEADLLVGADGVHSTVRRQVFGDESRYLRHLGFHTAAFTFDAPEVHARIEGRAYLTDTVGRQMGFYALRGADAERGRVAAFAVHRTADRRPPDDVAGAVRAAYGDLGWVAPTALAAMPPAGEIYYDQVAQIIMPRWSSGRVVLAGDACHAVSLLAGQGASLGIAGAYLLADLLARGEPVGRALARYEELWRPVVEEKQKAGRSAARWFLPASPFQLGLRRAALRLARVPVFDRYVAAVLAGKSTALIRNMREARDAPRARS
ncbi:FAD-dependent monooxygenase [Actinomadura sp. WMMB 499]|uniref:FAD-dependent monooxygenase n=1 Tax=Actinomadura sp. WMMB 499 TaxID=1219491 RepID=UPI001244D54F|nr:FAD-dependent monooxygenase [Actinomadura sp. WMMB 499]QFG20858.1 FAD-dependent oxidoreductase [Actinomadura sp. WMMB 499]